MPTKREYELAELIIKFSEKYSYISAGKIADHYIEDPTKYIYKGAVKEESDRRGLAIGLGRILRKFEIIGGLTKYSRKMYKINKKKMKKLTPEIVVAFKLKRKK